MTILTATRSAILRIEGTVVSDVYASTDLIAVEMADLANEVATDIAKSHDWRALTKVASVVGDGSPSYALPSDYDRMVMAAGVDDATSWFWGYDGFQTVNEWMRYTSGAYATLAPGGWIILGGELQFYPAPNGTAQFPYISNAWAKAVDSTLKSTFTADTDTFKLDERLITLGLIWRWLAQKKMDYSEDMATYEMALSQEQARDKGARVIRSSSSRFGNAQVAYTGSAFP